MVFTGGMRPVVPHDTGSGCLYSWGAFGLLIIPDFTYCTLVLTVHGVVLNLH